MSIRADIEYFHLTFCRHLLTAQDKSLIVLKGGCNMRFFLGSDRYSEDIDFDIQTIAKETLKRRVEKVLASQNFRTSLAIRKIAITSSSAPKQTDTVQRWKMSLRSSNLDIPTKVEFSRRGIEASGTSFDTIASHLLAAYQLTPTFMTHYLAPAAIHQKIEALAGRTETQARDIYDLDLLNTRHPSARININAELFAKAIECAMSVSYEQFMGQVVEFLSPEAQEYYRSKKRWDDLQARVVSTLESLSQ